jgi:predicted metal-dependent enzyme (double-stranded beta helix superfamily)
VPGDVERLSPREGDIHQVTNAVDCLSISIHVYGADIGRVHRHAFSPDGTAKTFISGYSDTVAPALWNEESLR